MESHFQTGVVLSPNQEIYNMCPARFQDTYEPDTPLCLTFPLLEQECLYWLSSAVPTSYVVRARDRLVPFIHRSTN